MVGNISSHRLTRSLSLASVHATPVYFFFHSLIADVIIRENGDGKRHTFSCSPYLLREKGMSKNDGDSDDDIGSVKFSFFLYTFSQIEERPILEGPLATHGSLRTGSWAYPHLSNEFNFGSHHSELPTYYGLKRQTLST
ncbi:hypothetical protein J3E68DRAFT_180183 [Trichoderma sp. SZMC 28012]